MWTELSASDDLLPVQKYILQNLEQSWSSKPKLGILSPRQSAVNRAVIEFVIKKQEPALILCSDEQKMESWRRILRSYGSGDSEVVSRLGLNQEITPFNLATYGSLANPMNATADEKYVSRAIWEYEMASVGAWSNEHDNIGDYDAVKETGVMLNDQAIRQTSTYNEKLLRFMELPVHVDVCESGWLNPHIDEFLKKMETANVGMIICDDSFEVTGIWAEVLNLLSCTIRTAKIIGLTPLMPDMSKLSARNFQLQTYLFDSYPIVVKLPLMVRDGCFKPYRGLIALTKPTEEESTFLSQANKNLQILLDRVQDSKRIEKSLSDFVHEELELLETDIPGNWAKRRNYIESLLNFVAFFHLKVGNSWKMFVQKLENVSFEGNIPVIRDFIYRILLASKEPNERRLGESLIIAFRPLGYELNELKIEKSTSLIPNILNRSQSKENALVDYLTQEFISLQRDLKAVIVCDFIDNTSATEIFPGNEFDGSTCGMMSILRKLEATPITLQMNPIVFYADTIYFNNKYKALLSKEVEKVALECDHELDVVRAEESGYCYIQVTGPESSKQLWKPLFQGLMANKITHCLILSREFLNDKWDGVNFNTYFNMSSAESQLFGVRFLSRLLLRDSDEVDAKHLWDFCTVMPEIELGLSDYRRVAKRKAHGWHICEDGEFEQGISYFHSALELGTEKFPDDLIKEVNGAAERLINLRKETKEAWLNKVREVDASREVLELSRPKNSMLNGKLSYQVLKNKKPSNIKLAYNELLERMCEVVLKTIVDVDKIERSPKLEITSRSEGVYRVEVCAETEELTERVFVALESLFAPLKNQSYIVLVSYEDKASKGLLSRIFSDSDRIQVPFAVPDCFTKKAELGAFLKNWQAMVSNDKMLGHRLPEVKNQVKEMQYNMPFSFYPNCRTCRLLV
ncbi:MAG: hypothetical protein MK132_20485 [Lentisphaerales bacterium]|nr:hypothetical protein [Lentisphaerales bacterium]